MKGIAVLTLRVVAQILTAIACANCVACKESELAGTAKKSESFVVQIDAISTAGARPATGFFAKRKGRVFLVTNRHVVLGITEMGMPLDTSRVAAHDRPTALRLRLPQAATGRSFRCTVPLYDIEGRQLWWEHPMGGAIDLAASAIDTNSLKGILLPWIDFDSPAETRNIVDLRLVGFGFPDQTESENLQDMASPVEFKGRLMLNLEAERWKAIHCQEFYPWASKIELASRLVAAEFDLEDLRGASGSPVFSGARGVDAVAFIGVYSASMTATSELTNKKVGKGDFLVSKQALLELLD